MDKIEFIKITYDYKNETETRKFYSIPCLYVNTDFDINKSNTSNTSPTQNYNLVYKVLIDPKELEKRNIVIDLQDKIILNSREFGILKMNKVENNGTGYLIKLEFGL